MLGQGIKVFANRIETRFKLSLIAIKNFEFIELKK